MPLGTGMPSISNNVLSTLNTVNKQVGSALTMPMGFGGMAAGGLGQQPQITGAGIGGQQANSLAMMMDLLQQLASKTNGNSPEAKILTTLAQMIKQLVATVSSLGFSLQEQQPTIPQGGMFGGAQIGGNTLGLGATPQGLLAQTQQFQQLQQLQQMGGGLPQGAAQLQQLQQMQQLQQLQQMQALGMYIPQAVPQGGIADVIDPSILNGANSLGFLGNAMLKPVMTSAVGGGPSMLSQNGSFGNLGPQLVNAGNQLKQILAL